MVTVDENFIRNRGYRELQRTLSKDPYIDHCKIRLNSSRRVLENELIRINEILNKVS